MLLNEHEVTPQDILELSSPDRFAFFFNSLGYNTDADILPANELKEELHTDEDLRNKILFFRQLAKRSDETFSDFFVYFYVLPSVTATIGKNIFRDLSKRHGDFLAVLTDRDYKDIDIIYIDRTIGVSTAKDQFTQSMLLDTPAVKVGPAQLRVLSIDRRYPTKVALRVLNRLRWVKNRSVAMQSETLSSAYDIADWSEEYFNNHALFSDHYLIEILPSQEKGEWKDTTRSGKESSQLTNVYTELRAHYEGAHDTFINKSDKELREQLITPALNTLDFAVLPATKLYQDRKRLPDYTLFEKDPSGKPASKVAVCLAYKWGRNLDSYEEVEDLTGENTQDPTAQENPGATVITMLDQEQVSWAILTNGKTWRLYSAKTHSHATNYYEIALEETLAIPREQAEEAKKAFRYFWLLFRADAFIAKSHPGYTEELSFLDWLLRESENYAVELGKSLKNRIFEDIFIHFSEGLVHHAQEQGTLPRNMAALLPEQRDKLLKPFFNGTLTFLYRLLFLLYAESRNLLPIHEQRGYYQHSLTKLKTNIADKTRANEVQAREKIELLYSESSYELYDYLQMLFAAIDMGNEELNVPVYNGGLFITQSTLTTDINTPEAWENLIDIASPEEIVTHILATYKIPDRSLVFGLDKLARDEDKKRHGLVQVDYKSLGVRQLGSIYEGLLEFKLRMAIEEMVIVREKEKEKIIPLDEAVRLGQYYPEKTLTIQPNHCYIENDRHERKETGSYYTPNYVVRYIVEHTVGPVLDEKEKSLLPKFREFEIAIQQKQKENRNLQKKGISLKDLTPTYLRHGNLVNEFFDIKVLDPAMGSGHFLVEAVDYITRRMIKFLDQVPNNPVRNELKRIEVSIAEEMEQQHVQIDRTRLTEINLLKRQVLKRCIYGVDINPMAVELAKVSVWLDSFTLGAPLSFLDHHLKCGDSLIGAKIREAEKHIKDGQRSLFSGNNIWARALLSTEGMIRVSKLTDVTPSQARISKEEYKKSETEIAPFKRLLNVYLSRQFSNPIKYDKNKMIIDKAIDFLYSDEAEKWVENANKAYLTDGQKEILLLAEKDAKEHDFFHWEFEFPDVFIDLKYASLKKNAGFDAIIGNPPYIPTENMNPKKKEYYATHYPVSSGKYDLSVVFLMLSSSIISYAHKLGMIVPTTWQTGDNYKVFREKNFIQSVFGPSVIINLPFDVFPDAYVDTCIAIFGKPAQKTFSVFAYAKKQVIEQNIMAGQQFDNISLDQVVKDSEYRIFMKNRYYTFLAKFSESVSIRLSEITEACQGPVESFYIYSDFAQGEDWLPYISCDVYRYQSQPIQRKFIKFGKGNPLIKFYTTPRILIRRIVSRTNRLMAVIAEEPFVVKKDLNPFILTATKYDLYFVLANINSTLHSYLYTQASTAAGKDDFRQTTLSALQVLPIRRINFVTPSDKLETDCKVAMQLYNQYIQEILDHDKDEPKYVQAFVDYHLSKEIEASDIIHDFLVFLAKEMIRLNKEKYVLPT